MELRNMKISTRLSLGFGAMLLFVAMLGGLAFYQSNRLWQNTSDLYNHPLHVARAVREIKADVLQMNSILKDITTNTNISDEDFRNKSIRLSETETNIEKAFQIVRDRYLGSQIHIDSAFTTYTRWKAISNEIIALSKNNNHEAAQHLLALSNNTYEEKFYHQIQVMIDFSKDKADAFFVSAEKEKKLLFIRLWVAITMIFLITLFYAYYLIRGISQPMLSLTNATEAYKNGNYNVRNTYNSNNEIGILSGTFNQMADTVQAELDLKSNANAIAGIIANENELKKFCQLLLNELMIRTNAQMAAIYFANSEKNCFEHFDSIGLDKEHIKTFSSDLKEGEFGAVLATKKIQRITQISEPTMFTFTAVSGKYLPREIITIPLIENEAVVGIISLASLHVFSNHAFRLVNEILMALTARINGVRLFQKISDFSAKLNLQNKELEEKTNEMMMQSEELKEYNIELEMQKKQLDEANQLKSAFLSNMSHELRTPLNSVIALSGVLSRRLKNKLSDDEYTYLGIIEKNGKQLLTLINDILDLSRIEAGKEELNFSEFSLQTIVGNILDTIEPISRQKGLIIKNKLDPDFQHIISDSLKCHHIIQNIISNAVKFTDKGYIEIWAKRVSEYINITVKDTGIGISPEHLPFIFDEFRQADGKASRKYSGTGLGLAIAKKYALLLNGNIEVESEPGYGSTFTVILPIAPAGVLTPKAANENSTYPQKNPNTETTAYHPEQKTILLVEDSEPQIIQLKDILTAAQYNVQIARNGKEALDSIKISIPDAMILDLMMPEVDGFEVLQNIRNLNETRSIPVLILSAKHVTKEELSFLIENNIHQLVQKGDISRNDLLAHIRNMIQLPVKEALQDERHTPVEPLKSAKPRILHIEDNPDNLISVKALLSDNYEITDASDGKDGVKKAVENIPDLILLDISLPEMDGFTVFNELRKDNRFKNIPIIALTARAMKGDREKLLEHGFDAYISKPIDNETFEKTINQWLYGK